MLCSACGICKSPHQEAVHAQVSHRGRLENVPENFLPKFISVTGEQCCWKNQSQKLSSKFISSGRATQYMCMKYFTIEVDVFVYDLINGIGISIRLKSPQNPRISESH